MTDHIDLPTEKEIDPPLPPDKLPLEPIKEPPHMPGQQPDPSPVGDPRPPQPPRIAGWDSQIESRV